MWLLLQRFAKAVVAKLTKVAAHYTIIRVEERAEDLLQAGARFALAWLMLRSTYLIRSFPYLHPEVSATIRADLDRLAWDLYSADLKGAT